jgi:hypothetical protein
MQVCIRSLLSQGLECIHALHELVFGCASIKEFKYAGMHFRGDMPNFWFLHKHGKYAVKLDASKQVLQYAIT